VNIAIVGCGLIGHKRAAALAGARLAVCADTEVGKARQLASLTSGCEATEDWRRAVQREDVSAVIVATSNNALAEITTAAIQAGKHVLVEKPAARHGSELQPVAALARERGVVVRVGFNHRYHRAMVRARQIVDSGELGPLLFLRARYGHGGRVGYEKEWRAQPRISGGGELIDQGVHLIDLSRWFLGDFVEIDGFAHTYFWNMPVDDNAFLTLKTAAKQVAFLHASCTEWKNTFSFELFGRNGKLQMDGLGGSYGLERLTYYRMRPEMGPPETTVWEYPQADNSWEIEMAEFLEDVRQRREPSPGLMDAIAALDIVDKIYRNSGYDHRA
jgi:predicted dehydrogenase